MTRRPLALLPRLALAFPRMTIVIGVIAVALAAAGLPRLAIRTDGRSLVPGSAPEVAYDRSVRDEFGVRDQFVVVITSDADDGIFTASTLALVREVTERLQALPGVDPADVMSLATERGDRVWPGTLDFRPFLDPVPRTDVEVRRVRSDLRVIDLYSGTIVSRDERSAGIFIGVPAGVDRTHLHRQVLTLLAEYHDRTERFDLVGGPVAETLLGTHLLDDLGIPDRITGTRVARDAPKRDDPEAGAAYRLRLLVARTVGLMPVAIGVMALVFYVFFRRLAAALLPLVEVGACLLFTFGLMGWLGVPVYLTIAVMPVILTAVGVADEIHVFHRFREHARAHPPDVARAKGREIVADTMREMTRPVVKTSVTTAIGFLSFALSPIGAVQAFGVFTAIGVAFCMLWSLTVIPASLRWLGPARLVTAPRQPGATRRSPMRWLGGAIARRPAAALAIFGVVIVAAPFGAARVIVQDSWIDGFSPDSVFRRAMLDFNERFLGAHVLLVTFDAGAAASDLRSDPDLIRAAGDLESFIADRREDAVGGVLGPCRYATTSNFLLSGRQEQYARVPETASRLTRVWDEFERVRGAPRLRNLLSADAQRAVVTVFLGHANFRDTARLMDEIRRYEREHLAPRGISLDFAGDVAVSQTLIGAIVSTQVRSVLLSIVGIFLVTSLLGRSLRWGVFCTLPCAIAVLVNFAAMGVVGVPLAVATSMFAGMTLGIGVDFAVHLMERFRLARERGAGDRDAIADAVAATGPAVVVDGLAVALGFMVLLLSQVPANARLGGLLALSTLACLGATLILLPALLAVWPPRGRGAGRGIASGRAE
ncbi:MAG: MMPL family transporter [Planctomycetes bacterium]|nr:MMPL family transporter [Planctomycetota bacterium]